MADVIIKNGTVITGSGKSAFKADVVISGEWIEAIEKAPVTAANGARVIDAQGKVVCPGIIDSHSHADLSVHLPNQAELLAPLVMQGITTFIGGNCGMSLAPITDRFYPELQMYLEGFTARPLDGNVSWRGMNGFMEHIETNGTLLNTALLAPHGLIRIDAMGMASRAATLDEKRRMERTLEECLDAGCIGMSTGLQYMPGLQCDTRELIHLGKTLKKYDGIYASHLRTYMNALDKAVNELVAVSRRNDIRGQISHIFWVPDMGLLGPVVRYFARRMIDLSKQFVLPIKMDAEIEKIATRIAKLRRRGIRIGMDVMPTTTTFTHLLAYFPPWVLEGNRDDVAARLLSKRMRRQMRRDIEFGQMVWPHTGRNSWSLNLFKLLGWESTRIMSVVTEKNRKYEGMRIADIAAEQGKHPFDAICDLLVDEEGRILVFSSLGEPEDRFTEQSIFAALSSPDVSISTDTILMGFGKPSHLFYGAYPKFFSRYVREMRMLNLETAVHKVTGLPARHFNLRKRGFIRQGYFADVLVFDPDAISPNVDFNNPVGRPSGVEHVFINGRHVVDGGEFRKGVVAGQLIRNSA